MNVLQLAAARRLPEDTAAVLRAFADDAESGRLTEFTYAYVRDGCYGTGSASSLSETVVLTSILHDWAVRRMRGEAG